MSEKTCEVCGYRFEPGDYVHEVALGIWSENMILCDMCYCDVLRRVK